MAPGRSCDLQGIVHRRVAYLVLLCDIRDDLLANTPSALAVSHLELAAYRVEGEWFACSLEVVMAALATAASIGTAGTIRAI
jgi:hypothetical protein